MRMVVNPRKWLVVIAALFTVGCNSLDNLLSVSPPDQVDEKALNNPGNAAFLMAGLVGDFEVALGSYIVIAGMAGNELTDADRVSTYPVELRQYRPEGFASFTLTQLFQSLSRARFQADNTLRLLDGWTDQQVPNRTGLIGRAAAYAGYSYVLIGEGMCTATFDAGPEQTRAQVFDLANQRFIRAMEAAQAAGDDETLNMARVGSARALLDAGRSSDAGTTAAQVPDGFRKDATYSTATDTRQNNVYRQLWQVNRASVQPEFWHLTTMGAADPRVVVDSTGATGPDGLTEIWAPDKYSSATSPVPLATWEEAQLIVAEADLDAGQTQGAVDIINNLRTRVGLPAFASGDPVAVRNQIIYERSAELFLESQHFGDLYRFNLPLVPAPGTDDGQGNIYGDQRCFPLPAIEYRNNPNVLRS